MNTQVENNQAIDMRRDELWVTAFWNQLSVEPFRWESINATWQASSRKSCPRSTMYIEHWNMKASSFPGSDLSNGPWLDTGFGFGRCGRDGKCGQTVGHGVERVCQLALVLVAHVVFSNRRLSSRFAGRFCW